MTTIQFVIDPTTGLAECVCDAGTEPVVEALAMQKRRVSHIEPVNPALRFLFRAIRWYAHDTSALAGFTRRWPCRWRVNMVDGPTFGCFDRRADSLAAEREWLREERAL